MDRRGRRARSNEQTEQQQSTARKQQGTQAQHGGTEQTLAQLANSDARGRRKCEEDSNKLSAHVVLSENNESNERLCVKEGGGGRGRERHAHHRKPNP
jgi:hypothetical protein